jgi:hypothetical protein
MAYGERGRGFSLEVGGVLRWIELSRRSEARDAGVVPRRVEHVKVGWQVRFHGLAGVMGVHTYLH